VADHPSEQVDRVAGVVQAHQSMFKTSGGVRRYVCYCSAEFSAQTFHSAHVAEQVCAALDAATPPRLDADDVRDAVGDHYDHAPFPLWHGDRLIEAFDWEGIARTLNTDLGAVGSVGERDQ
jgi:hypothetical protein